MSDIMYEEWVSWYLMFGGSSADGRGNPYKYYEGRTTSFEEALTHLKKCKKDPYCFGGVVRVTTETYEWVTEETI